MRFPKPIVYFGFILIVAAFGAGMYDTFFKSSEAVEDPKVVQRKMVAGRIVDSLFDQFKLSLEEKEGFKIETKDFDSFKKVHKGAYISKYLILEQELGSGKYNKEESLKMNEDFTVSAINQLKKVYIRKFKLSIEEAQVE